MSFVEILVLYCYSHINAYMRHVGVAIALFYSASRYANLPC